MNIIKNKIKNLFKPSSQYILNIGDKGATLTYTNRNKAQNAWLSKQEPKKSFEKLKKAFKIDESAPVSIQIDVSNQDYKIVKVPRANIFEKQKIVKRQLHFAFSDSGIKKAYRLGKISKNQDEYLFINITTQEVIKDWVNLIKTLNNPFCGVFIQSVEFGKTIEKILTNSTSKWKIFAAKSALNSYRFIVTRDNKTVFSRVTNVPTAQTKQERLQAFRKDITSTIAYIKRIGFKNEDKIDYAIIAPEELIHTLEKDDFDLENKKTILSLSQAEKILQIKNCGKDETGFYDMLNATWFAYSDFSKEKINLEKTNIKDVDSFITIYKKAVITISSLIFCVFASINFYNAYILKKEISIKTAKLQNIKKQRKELIKNQKQLPYKPEEIRKAIDFYEIINKDEIFNFTNIKNKLFDIFNKHKKEFKRLTINKIAISPYRQDIKLSKRKTKTIKTHKLEIELNLPSDIYSSREALQFCKIILSYFKNELKNAQIKIKELPANLVSNNILVGGADYDNLRSQNSPPYQVSFEIISLDKKTYHINGNGGKDE